MPLPNQDATQVVTNNGLRTQYGVIIPPGAKVAAFVRSTGIQDDGNDAFLSQNLVTTLAAGLARARSGRGDFVVCLPGHVEAVVDATTFSGALLAGTKILGVGQGSTKPTFQFGLPASSWVVSKADVVVAGIRIVQTNGGNPLVGVAVSGADFGFYNNEIVLSSGGNSFVNEVIQLQAGADRADISGNIFRGPAGLPPGIDITGVVTDVRIADNEMVMASSTTNGCIRVSAAATGLKILRNTLSNTTAASVCAINLANVNITGQCAYNTITVLNTGAVTSGTTGITIGAAVTMGFFQNYVVNDPLKSGLLLPTVDT